MSAVSRCLVVAAAIGLAACSPTYDWRDVRIAGELNALFPCKVRIDSRRFELASAPVTMEMASCAAGGRTFALAWIDVGRVERIAPVLEALRLALVANVGAGTGAVIAEPSSGVPGATAHPLAAGIRVSGRRDGESLYARAEFLTRGRHVFQATVLGSEPAPAIEQQYFSSLRFVP